jgi:hypothetical protein
MGVSAGSGPAVTREMMEFYPLIQRFTDKSRPSSISM